MWISEYGSELIAFSSETNSSSESSDRQVTPVRLRKKKLVRNPRRKGVGSRTSVAQVVERVTTQMRMVRPQFNVTQ